MHKICQRYEAIPSAVISDVLRSAGAPHQVLHRDLHQVGKRRRFAAPAFCVRGERVLGSIKPESDKRFQIYRDFRDGAALLLAAGGYDTAVVFGENVALSLKMKGCQAIVTDGGIRDGEAMDAMGMPVHAAFVTPLSGGRQWVMLDYGVPVMMRGQSSAFVRVAPGDLVVGDADGVVVVPKAGIERVLEICEGAMAAEERTRNRILAGEDPEAAYAAEPRQKNVQPFLSHSET